MKPFFYDIQEQKYILCFVFYENDRYKLHILWLILIEFFILIF